MRNTETPITSSRMHRHVGRSVYLLREIAERAGLSVSQVYREVDAGRLKVLKLGTGSKPVMRVTAEDEAEWLESKREPVS